MGGLTGLAARHAPAQVRNVHRRRFSRAERRRGKGR
jgi:hypothetical protein